MTDVRPLQYPPSKAVLEAEALEFYRLPQNKRRYRRLKASGELDQAIENKVANTQQQARSLMFSGVWENEAWNRAIRSEILESESD